MNYETLLILGGGLLLIGFLLTRKDDDDNISKEIKLGDNIKDKEK